MRRVENHTVNNFSIENSTFKTDDKGLEKILRAVEDTIPYCYNLPLIRSKEYKFKTTIDGVSYFVIFSNEIMKSYDGISFAPIVRFVKNLNSQEWFKGFFVNECHHCSPRFETQGWGNKEGWVNVKKNQEIKYA